MNFKKIFISVILLGLAVTLLGINSADAKHSIIGLTVLTPNGTEKWEVEKTYEISWKAKGLKKVSIGLWASDKLPVSGRSSSSFAVNSGVLDAQQGSYKWTINPKEIGLDISKYKYYKIAIDGYTRIPKGFPGRPAVRDVSDRYFSIIESPTQSSITVLSPNGGQQPGGAEQWVVGNSYNIQWQSRGVDKVKLQINYSKALFASIASGVDASKGSYSWTIPSNFFTLYPNFKAGSSFTVSAIRENPDGTYDYTTQDESDNYFSIVSAATATQKLPPCGSYGDITNDGYVTKDDAVQLATKYLLNQLDETSKTRGDVNKDGKIDSTDTKLIEDYAAGLVNTFPICAASVQPSITVLSPNGGEQWKIGETRRITWTSTGINKVWIKYSDGSGNAFLIASLDTNPGYYDWVIPSSLITGSSYRIEVVDPVTVVLDWSDDYFSIVSPTAAL